MLGDLLHYTPQHVVQFWVKLTLGNRQQKRQVVVFYCVTAGFVHEQAEGPGRYVNVRVAGARVL